MPICILGIAGYFLKFKHDFHKNHVTGTIFHRKSKGKVKLDIILGLLTESEIMRRVRKLYKLNR